MADPACTIPCPLWTAAQRAPGDPALIDRAGVWTFADLEAHVADAALALAAHGIAAGDVVAAHLAPARRSLVLLLALFRRGALVCPLNRRLPPSSLSGQVRALPARWIVTDAGDAVPWPATVACLAAETLAPDACRPRLDAAPSLAVPPAWNLDCPATLLHTSGTTAAPKVAVHSLGNHLAAADASNARIPLGPGDRWLLALPLYHVGGLAILFRCLRAGAAMVLADGAAGDPLGRMLDQTGVTHLSLVPTQLARLLQERDTPFAPRLSCLLLGGAPAPDGLVTAALAQGLPVHKTYGLTEMGSQVSTVPAQATAAQQLTAGLPLGGCDVRCADDGEILVRGPALFLGYRGPDGTVTRPVDGGGWFATGDLGEFGPDGYLRVHGRKDHLFISGGENIQPEEIELAMAALEGIDQVVVVPRADAEFGQRPVAFVHTRDGRLQPEAWSRALAAVLPRFKIPVAYLPIPPEARTETLKVQRRHLQERV